MTRYVEPNRDVQLQGHYAGMVSRLLAWVIDAFLVGIVFALLYNLLELGIGVVTGTPFDQRREFCRRSVARAMEEQIRARDLQRVGHQQFRIETRGV